MTIFRLVLMGLLVISVLAACSDKQKEAARLEQEMKDMESGADTLAAEAAVDTIPEPSAADADAIPEEIAPSPEPMPPAPSGDGYTVQVASCEDETYARYLLDLYRDRGYDPFVNTFTLEGQLYYRVRIGIAPTLSEANALKQEIQDKYSIECWIDQHSY
jgi:cell division septation protein DedD